MAWPAGVIIYKRLGKTIAPTQLNLRKNTIVMSFLLPSLYFLGGSLPRSAELPIAIGSGAIGSAIGETWHFTALRGIGTARMCVCGHFAEAPRRAWSRDEIPLEFIRRTDETRH